MKKKALTAFVILLFLSLGISFSNVSAATTKTLVAYFSATGNTEPLAGYASEILGADLFEIIPEQPYTAADLDYYSGGRCDQEQADATVRPLIKNKVENMDQYDTVIIGHPIWHGQAPRIISTFLESYDFSGKRVVTFCTSHSSGLGSSAQYLHSLVSKDVTWLTSKRFPSSGTTKDQIQTWLNDIGLKRNDESDSEIFIRIGCTILKVRLEDTQAAKELKNLLKENPLSISMTGNRFEQYGEIGRSLSTNNETITAQPGDILLYKGDTLCVFYGNNTYSYTKIGRIQDTSNAELTQLLSGGNKTITWYDKAPSSIHSLETVGEKKATCTEDGYTGDKVCSICKETIEKGNVIQTTGHLHTEIRDSKEATCKEEGFSGNIYCTDCGDLVKKGDVVQKKDHTIVIDQSKDATTSSPGLTEGSHCSVCGEIIKAQEVIPKKDIQPSKPAISSDSNHPTVEIKENQITSQKNDGDPVGSTYGMLSARVKKSTKTANKIGWNRVSGASGYLVYGNRCGAKFRFVKIADVKGTSYTHRGLKKGKYYKYVVVAYKNVSGSKTVITTSKTMHAATTGGKVGNCKKLKLNKTKVTLKLKKTFRIKVKEIPAKKKLKIKKHRRVSFESTNPRIATVTSSGKIRAIKKGSCKIYVFAQNGMYKVVWVRVK